ncbi:MAG: diguanylate cyclase [Magnetococcales bacterium]|nr:diguanylate cyclase [Magnetococcales bacterium]
MDMPKHDSDFASLNAPGQNASFPKPLNKLAHYILGGGHFSEDEEYFRFQFHFLFSVMLTGLLITALFFVAEWQDWNHVGETHLFYQKVYFGITICLLSFMWGRKHLFKIIAWIYGTMAFLLYIVALIYVPADELRVAWFYLQIAGVYILLGQKAGLATTIASVGVVVALNHHLSAPYSPNAIATYSLSIVASSLFFHIYTTRSMSFYQRMLESNRKYRELASRDPLTGLMNARAFYEGCDRMIHLAQRSGTPFSVLFIDLDHFKSINDRYGHEAGDTVLKGVANCMIRQTRQSDLLGRIGGEEFSMFLQNTDLQGARLLAEKLRQEIEASMPRIGDTALRITASIGLARSEPHHHCIADIQRLADQAMYMAKKQGRNRVTCFDEVAPLLH